MADFNLSKILNRLQNGKFFCTAFSIFPHTAEIVAGSVNIDNPTI